MPTHIRASVGRGDRKTMGQRMCVFLTGPTLQIPLLFRIGSCHHARGQSAPSFLLLLPQGAMSECARKILSFVGQALAEFSWWFSIFPGFNPTNSPKVPASHPVSARLCRGAGLAIRTYVSSDGGTLCLAACHVLSRDRNTPGLLLSWEGD